MGCQQIALRNISAYLQVKMRISLKYMIEGMLKIPSREKTNATGGVLADMFCFIYEGWNFNSGNYLFTTDTK